MSTEELIGILTERGLRVVVTPDGPRLRGDRARATPTLLAVLRWHRAALAARFAPPDARPAPAPAPQPPRPRQWKWPGNLIMPDFPADKGGTPPGATHWRFWGESEWKEVAR